MDLGAGRTHHVQVHWEKRCEKGKTRNKNQQTLEKAAKEQCLQGESRSTRKHAN